MSFLDPSRWLLYGGLAVALTAGYFAWADHVGDAREASVRAEYTDAREKESIKNAAVAAKFQKDKDEALQKANIRAQASKRDADLLATVNRGLRDDLATQRSNLSSASLDSCRNYAATASTILGECADAVEKLAGEAEGYSSDSLTLQQAWPRP